MQSSRMVPLALAVSLTAACASSSPTVDMSDSLRVLGRENDVRVDAQLFTNELAPARSVNLVYEIHNLRAEPIVFSPVDPSVDYHLDSRTITVGLGAEIPMGPALENLIVIEPGQKKSFSTGALMSVHGTRMPRLAPRYLRVKLNYLEGASAFRPFLDRHAPPEVADEGLFRKWVDHIGAVFTNALPIRWGGAPPLLPSASARMPSQVLP